MVLDMIHENAFGFGFDVKKKVVFDDADSNAKDILNEESASAGSPPKPSIESGVEKSDEVCAIMKEICKLQQTLDSAPEEDLSQYYYSDEEETSDEMEYTEWDAMEYTSEVELFEKVNDSKVQDEEAERQQIAKMLQKREHERRQHSKLIEHEQFDLDCVKALWLQNLDVNHTLPAFNMILTCHEDDLVFQRLCVA